MLVPKKEKVNFLLCFIGTVASIKKYLHRCTPCQVAKYLENTYALNHNIRAGEGVAKCILREERYRYSLTDQELSLQFHITILKKSSREVRSTVKLRSFIKSDYRTNRLHTRGPAVFQEYIINCFINSDLQSYHLKIMSQ